MNVDEVASSQSKAIDNKASYWRKYIELLTGELNATLEYYPLREASLWASTFAYIEWLVAFDQRTDWVHPFHVEDTLLHAWGWSKEVSKLFWKSGRNPIAHVGQANSFHSYDKFQGLDTNVSLNSANNWSPAVTGEWDKYHPHKAVAILPPLDMEDKKIQMVTFFHQMLLSDLLPLLAEYVYERISKETDEANLRTIVSLNSQILH